MHVRQYVVSVQVDVPQQAFAADTNRRSDQGINVCGVMAALNVKRFLQGVEQNVQPGTSVCTGDGAIPLGVWILPHMARPLHHHVMEAARASGMRYLLEAILKYGEGFTLPQVDSLLDECFGDRCSPDPFSWYCHTCAVHELHVQCVLCFVFQASALVRSV